MTLVAEPHDHARDVAFAHGLGCRGIDEELTVFALVVSRTSQRAKVPCIVAGRLALAELDLTSLDALRAWAAYRDLARITDVLLRNEHAARTADELAAWLRGAS